MSTLKNELKKLIMSSILLLAAIAFISCGDTPNSGSDDSGDSGNNNNSTSTSDYEALSEEEVAAELKKLGDYVIGYETLHYEDSEGEYCELGRKGNTYWTLYSGRGSAYVLDGEDLHFYDASESDDGDYEWNYVMTMPSDALQTSLESMLNGFLTSFSFESETDASDDVVKVSGNEKVAGRACTHYKVSFSFGPAKNTLDVYVDNETKITMKVVETYTGGGITNTSCFEVKTFKTGNSVTAPDLPEAEFL